MDSSRWSLTKITETKPQVPSAGAGSAGGAGAGCGEGHEEDDQRGEGHREQGWNGRRLGHDGNI